MDTFFFADRSDQVRVPVLGGTHLFSRKRFGAPFMTPCADVPDPLNYKSGDGGSHSPDTLGAPNCCTVLPNQGAIQLFEPTLAPSSLLASQWLHPSGTQKS